MCGIAGVLNLDEPRPIAMPVLGRMIQRLHHRGPDEFGLYRDPWIGLASARLSIVDLSGGQQPIGNEDGSLWIVFNGEIFNYVELRSELEAKGHHFSSHCDTEVIVHLYEEHGVDCLRRLNGQFAIALWDTRQQTLLLARDRLGIRPLYYTRQGGQLIFASEIKSILTQSPVRPAIDAEALRQVFTFWSPVSPCSIFRSIHEVQPGHFLIARAGGIEVRPYWQLEFTDGDGRRSEGDYLEELENLLRDATRLRLRADVPVGAYLSGGLDSSITAAMIRNHNIGRLDTFSIAFADPAFDESAYQRQMAAFLGTQHQEVFCTHEDIGRVLPDVIWHTETPILRTAPVPMFLLSQLVHRHDYKVVLTGEGADELLAGYDLFKELQIRRFWARNPQSQLRPILLQKLYPEIPRLAQNFVFLTAFFARDLENTDSPFYSHDIRWTNTRRTWRFLAGADGGDRGSDATISDAIQLPLGYAGWSALAKAQYLEITTFLSPYLLASQGDRVTMAHSVEGRYPFLDYRVVEFCNRLPGDLKLRGLQEKWLLRQLGRKLLPDEIWQRRKRPYRAPIQRSFFTPGSELDYVRELLAPGSVKNSGYFNPQAVERLVQKASTGGQISEVEEMALVGILSTLLVDVHFVSGPRRPQAELDLGGCRIIDQVVQPAAA